jgi:hypothetical protein
MARQIGIVIGVAALVATLAHIDAVDPLATFRNCLALIIGLFTGAGLIAGALLAYRPRGTGTGMAGAHCR